MFCPVSSWISFDKRSDVSGPVAIIVIPSSHKSFKCILFPISSFITSISGFLFISSVTFSENISLSTANACPAGTLVSSAIFINNESNFLNSSFNRPHAFVSKFYLNELLHTISA